MGDEKRLHGLVNNPIWSNVDNCDTGAYESQGRSNFLHPDLANIEHYKKQNLLKTRNSTLGHDKMCLKS